MSAGKQSVPLVIRMIIGKGWGQGPQHSQSLEVLFSHIPGLKVVAPSNASDAKALLITSIKENHPVIFFEHRWLHDIKGKVENKKKVEIGKAKIIKKGNDLTIVSFSEALIQVMRIYNFLKLNNISAEIIDLRSLRPLDEKTILKSVSKTGKIIVIDNGWTKYGIASEVISLVVEKGFKFLKSPPKKLGVKNISISSSRTLAEKTYLNSNKIIQNVFKILNKNINKNKLSNYIRKYKNDYTDIPYQDFKGPF